ncbi:MAG: NAD(P)-binding protein [Verrucomicrobiota bacterium]
MDCVVGSGPAGMACAAALLKQGRRVLMLDAGIKLEPDRAQLVAHLGQIPAPQWTTADLARIKEGMNPGAAGIPQKLLFGSDFPYRDAERELGVSYGATGLRASLALGGLSTVWGSAMLPYAQQDIADWPITTEQLAPHYRAVVETTGLAAAHDELEELFPLHTETFGQLNLSRQAQTIQAAMTRNHAALRIAGFRHGRARIAIRVQAAGANQSASTAAIACTGCAYGCSLFARPIRLQSGKATRISPTNLMSLSVPSQSLAKRFLSTATNVALRRRSSSKPIGSSSPRA